MTFGESLGEACATFAVTNVDDIFVLVTFYAEATTSSTLTPLKIVTGQYVGFTIIMAISMIGFGVSMAIPSEPIGFLGLLPIMLGFWKFCHLIWPKADEEESDRSAGLRSVLKVASVTLMNGGDNIATYIPLFSQVRPRGDIAIFVVTYYVLLGVWCLAAYLIMRQKHILRLAEKVIDKILPFLYMGLGIFIIVKSDCYPWTFEKIDDSTGRNDAGEGIMAGVTAVLLVTSLVFMVFKKVSQRRAATIDDNGEVQVDGSDESVSRQPSEVATPK